MTDLTKLAQLAEQHSNSYASPHHFVLSVSGLRSIIEAALRDAPQAEPLLTVDEYQAKYANVITLTEKMRYGYECLYHELTRTPSAPTAVEPDERAMFEAWAEPITALAKENGKHVEVMTSLAWEAWQARASKGTK